MRSYLSSFSPFFFYFSFSASIDGLRGWFNGSVVDLHRGKTLIDVGMLMPAPWGRHFISVLCLPLFFPEVQKFSACRFLVPGSISQIAFNGSLCSMFCVLCFVLYVLCASLFFVTFYDSIIKV